MLDSLNDIVHGHPFILFFIFLVKSLTAFFLYDNVLVDLVVFFRLLLKFILGKVSYLDYPYSRHLVIAYMFCVLLIKMIRLVMTYFYLGNIILEYLYSLL